MLKVLIIYILISQKRIYSHEKIMIIKNSIQPTNSTDYSLYLIQKNYLLHGYKPVPKKSLSKMFFYQYSIILIFTIRLEMDILLSEKRNPTGNLNREIKI